MAASPPSPTLRLFLFIQDEPFHLAKHLPQLLDRFDVVGIALMDQKLPSDSWPTLLGRYMCLLGVWGFVRMAATVMAYKMVGKGSLARLFKGRGLNVQRVKSIRDPHFIQHVRDSGATLLVSIASPQIFSAELLRSVPQGGINLHGGVLPDFPGVLTPFWNLYESAQEAGCTVHVMTGQVDAGPILGQRKFPITAEDSVQSLYAKISEQGIALLCEVLRQMEQGPVMGRTVTPVPGRYHSFPTWAQGREFRRKGRRFF